MEGEDGITPQSVNQQPKFTQRYYANLLVA